MVAAIDQDRQLGNLSSAIRLFVLDYYRGTQNGVRSETKTPIIGAAAGLTEQVLRAD
jgi:predicted DNA-binding ribbon-helix-helix protein